MTARDKQTSQYVDNYEDVSVFGLSQKRERTLLDCQTECTFMWTTRDGAPMGVIMNYVVHGDRFWVTCTRRRKRVAAIEARPEPVLSTRLTIDTLNSDRQVLRSIRLTVATYRNEEVQL